MSTTKIRWGALSIHGRACYHKILYAVVHSLLHAHSPIQFGHTALFFASINGHMKIVQMLLQQCADVSISDAVCLVCVLSVLCRQIVYREFFHSFYHLLHVLMEVVNPPTALVTGDIFVHMIPYSTCSQCIYLQCMTYMCAQSWCTHSMHRMAAVHSTWPVKKATLRWWTLCWRVEQILTRLLQYVYCLLFPCILYASPHTALPKIASYTTNAITIMMYELQWS